MNRSILALAAVAVGAVIVGETRAQDELGKMDVAAIKKIQFIEKGKDIWTQSVIKFQNDGDKVVKLRNAKFKLVMKSGDVEIPMGATEVAELVFAAATKAADGTVTPSFTEASTEAKMGPKDEATILRLITLFNVFGDPEARNKATLFLAGDAEVGKEISAGRWVWTKVTLEMDLSPKIALKDLM